MRSTDLPIFALSYGKIYKIYVTQNVPFSPILIILFRIIIYSHSVGQPPLLSSSKAVSPQIEEAPYLLSVKSISPPPPRTCLLSMDIADVT